MTYAPELGRKTYLLQYFQEYMAKTLQREVGWTFVDEGRTNHLDYLVKTYRMKKAIVFKLSNDVIQVRRPPPSSRVDRLTTCGGQINFWDHQKLLLTDSAKVVTFIEPDLSLHAHSIGALFAEASSLGLFSAASSSLQSAEDGKGRSRRDEVANMLSKLECPSLLSLSSSTRADHPST